MILIAPDSFKGSLSAIEVAENIKYGLVRQGISKELIQTHALSDGGDGFVECLYNSLKSTFQKIICSSKDALGQPIQDTYLWNEQHKTALIEMASSCGLAQIKASDRSIFRSSTYGCGITVNHAIQKEATTIYIGLGGSATNDGGAGFLAALGMKAIDQNEQELSIFHPKAIAEIIQVDFSSVNKLNERSIKFIGATDVQNPLLGDQGASQIFAPQKGASKQDIEVLEELMHHWSILLKNSNNAKKIDPVQAGSGAAGGLGFALLHLPNSELRAGFETFAQLTDLETKLKKTTLLITAEGRMDRQSLYGKAPFALMKLAKKLNPKICVIGISAAKTSDQDSLTKAGFDEIRVLQKEDEQKEEAIKHTVDRLRKLFSWEDKILL